MTNHHHQPHQHRRSGKIFMPPLHLVSSRSSTDEYSYGSSIKDVSAYEELENIIQLASQPLPERPDGIVSVVQYASMVEIDSTSKGEYERMSRQNPATLFLRCYKEFEGADVLLGQANVQMLPTYDIFYGGIRVARVEGSSIQELQDVLDRYQLQNSSLDLFSGEGQLSWGEKRDMAKTPKTTNRFVPGYDWNTRTGAFDEQASKVEQSFEDTFGNWLPNIDDDDDDEKK